MDLEYFLLRFLDLVIHQEVPKLLFQQQLRSRVDKTTAQQPNVQQFETNARQELGKFSAKILDLIIKHEIPELKLFCQQGLVDKKPAQQPNVQQFESTGFQDPQTAAAETSGSYYYSSARKLEGKRGGGKAFKNLYTKFFGGKIFTAMRVVFRGFFLAPTSACVTKNFEMWVVHTKNVDVLYLCRLASKNLRDLRVPPRSS